MAVGKSISNKAALYAEGGKNAPEIVMPEAGQQTPIEKAIDPWNPTFHEAQAAQQAESGLPSVPDSVPQETLDEMNYDQAQDQEVESVVEPEVEQLVEEQPTSGKKPSTLQANMKAIRESKEKAERERDAILAQMLEMQKRMYGQQQEQEKQEPVYDESDFAIDDDGLVEGKYVKKIVNEIKTLKKQQQVQQVQTHQAAMEAKIRTNYPDFEKVVSKENVEMLNQQFPDIAASLRDTQDLYSKASAAYTVIKKFGLYQEPKPDLYQNDRAQAVINAQKPRPLASVNPQQGDSPLSKANAFANGMTKDLQKQLLAEMMAAKKNH